MGKDDFCLWRRASLTENSPRLTGFTFATLVLFFLSLTGVSAENETKSVFKKGQVAISHVKSMQGATLQNSALQARDSLFALTKLNEEAFLLVGNKGFAVKASTTQLIKKITLPSSANLFSAHTVQSEHVLVGGEQGRLFISDKSATQWKTIKLDANEAIFDFIESPSGEIVLTGTYGLLMASNPPYINWASIQLPWADYLKNAWDEFGEADPHLYSGCHNQRGELLVVGEFGLVLKRGLDGVWQKIHGGSIEPAIYSCVISPDGLTITAVGQKGLIHSSTDGGVTWLQSDISAGVDLYKIQNFNGASIITGDNRTLYVSLNNGDWSCLRFADDAPLGWFIDTLVIGEQMIIVGSNGGFKSATLQSLSKARNQIKDSQEFVACE